MENTGIGRKREHSNIPRVSVSRGRRIQSAIWQAAAIAFGTSVAKVIRPKNFDENICRGGVCARILKVSPVLLANKDRREGATKLQRHLSRGARCGMAKREEALWRHIGWSTVPLASHLADDVRHARFSSSFDSIDPRTDPDPPFFSNKKDRKSPSPLERPKSVRWLAGVRRHVNEPGPSENEEKSENLGSENCSVFCRGDLGSPVPRRIILLHRGAMTAWIRSWMD